MKKGTIWFLVIAACACVAYGKFHPKAGNDAIGKGIQEVINENSEADAWMMSSRMETYLQQAADDKVKNDLGYTIDKNSIHIDATTCSYKDSAGIYYQIELEAPSGLVNESGSDNGENRIFYGLGDNSTAYYNCLERFRKSLDTSGVRFDCDTDVTVDDLQTDLEGKDIIMIEEHGSVTKSNDIGMDGIPFFVLTEPVTTKGKKEYKDDLEKNRVLVVQIVEGIGQDKKVVNKYAIMPEFFTYHYDSDDLSGSYVHLGCCMGFGTSGRENYTLGNAFLACGADTVSGYVNSVFTDYDSDLMSDVMNSLSGNNPLNQAFTTAMANRGYDDGEYMERCGMGSNPGVISKLQKDGRAFIRLLGNENWMMQNGYTGWETPAVEEPVVEQPVVEEPIPEEPEIPQDTRTVYDSYTLNYQVQQLMASQWNLGDYPEMALYRGVDPVTFPYALVDLTHDGSPELVVLSNGTSGSEFNRTLCVYTMKDYGSAEIYERSIASAHYDTIDVYLTYYAGEWYLTDRITSVYGGELELSFDVYSLSDDGSQVYLAHKDVPIISDDSELYTDWAVAYRNDLFSYLDQSVLVYGSNIDSGTDLMQ